MKLIYDKITYVENIFNKIHYDTFKVLSSKDREFNYVLLNSLYDFFCGENGGTAVLKEEVIGYLEQTIDVRRFKEIDDEDEQSIANKSKRDILLFKYNQFKKMGWLEDGYNKDLEIETNLTSSAIKILESLSELLNDDEGNEFVGYVFNTYQDLKNIDFDDKKNKHNSISLIEQAYKNSKEFSDNLYSMTSNIRRYTTELLNKDNYNVNDIVDNLFKEYNDKVGIKLFTNLKTRDHPRKYSKSILELVTLYLEPHYLDLIMSDYKITKHKIELEQKDYEYVKNKLSFIYYLYLNINKRIEELDVRNNNYLKVSEDKIKFIINESRDIEEVINESLKQINEVNDFSSFEDFFDLHSISTFDNESFYKPRAKYERIQGTPIEAVVQKLDEETKKELFKQIKESEEYLFPSINKFMFSLMKKENEIKATDVDKNIKSLAVKLFLGQIYQFYKEAKYEIEYLNEDVIIGNFKMKNFVIRRKKDER